jgi:SagB-type dehydrogenase family enzyme
MDIYALVGEEGIKGMAAGMYHSEPMGHRVSLILEGDLREEMARASLGQMWMATPPLSLVVCAEYARITSRYGDRGVRYAIIEAGHVGQNIFLQAEAMGLGAGIVGAFRDEAVIQVMGTPPSHEPLLIMPVGYKRYRLAPVESPTGCASAQFNGVKKLGGWEGLSLEGIASGRTTLRLRSGQSEG